MDLTYTWEFLKFNVYNSANSLDKVVYSIDWCLTGTDNQGHGAQVYGTSYFDTPDPLTFTPFEQLTHPQVEGWVTAALGNILDDYKSIIQTQIQNQIEPTTSSLGQPW